MTNVLLSQMRMGFFMQKRIAKMTSAKGYFLRTRYQNILGLLRIAPKISIIAL